MAEKSWYVSKDGTQLPGEMDTAAVKALLAREPGHAILVWAPGMANWAAPATLPEFAPEPAPVPVAPAAGATTPSAPPARPAMPRPAIPSREQMQEHAGVFKSLLDPSFEHYLTPRLVRTVYIVLMVVIAIGVVLGVLGSLAGAFAAFRFGGALRGIGTLVVALVLIPLAALIYLALFRVFLETVTVLFKIKDDLHRIAEKKE